MSDNGRTLGLIANTLLFAVSGILVISLGYCYDRTKDENKVARHAYCSDARHHGADSLVPELRSEHVCQRYRASVYGAGQRENCTTCRCCHVTL